MTAGQALKAWMERSKMEPRDLAPLIGCSRPRIYSLINDAWPPGLQLAVRIERVTGVPASSWARPETEPKSDSR